MKVIVLKPVTICLLLTLIVSSASAQSEEIRRKLIGTWDISKMGFDDNGNGKIDSLEIDTITQEDEFEAYFTFNEDGTGEMMGPLMQKSDQYKWELIKDGTALKLIPIDKKKRSYLIYEIKTAKSDTLLITHLSDDTLSVANPPGEELLHLTFKKRK